MKIVLELQFPPELQEILQQVKTAAQVYVEGATAFPPAEPTSASANAPPAEPAEEPVKDQPPSAPVSKKTRSKTKAVEETPAETPKTFTLADAKVAILSRENGHAEATTLLRKMGKSKLAELSGDELVTFLEQLGLAT